MKITEYQLSLLAGWEEVFKQGQLTLWIALALKDGPKYMAEIKDFIDKSTNGAIVADDRSIYRSLRRYDKADIVTFKMSPSEGGPERKIYSLSSNGKVILDAFCKRNIINVFYKPEVKKLIEKGMN